MESITERAVAYQMQMQEEGLAQSYRILDSAFETMMDNKGSTIKLRVTEKDAEKYLIDRGLEDYYEVEHGLIVMR